VERLELIALPGSRQWVLVRGRQGAPVLLLVQAGPGFPMIHEARALEAALRLEPERRVVYWDQRGAGKSFDPSDTGPLRVDDLVADLVALVRALCGLLDVPRLDLAGFSLGGTLVARAAAQDPEPVQSATLVGPDVNLREAERFAYAFALTEAERRGDRRAIRALRALGPPPHADAARFMERVRWVTNLGGIQRGTGFGALVRTNLLRLVTSPHYSLREAIGAVRGMGATQARLLADLQGVDLVASAPRVAVPVAVFQGRHDAAAPPELAQRYHDRLEAPRGKALVWFEQSAHLPHVEEPERFRRALLDWTGQSRVGGA
jgi:pimeloyl-ACP methyl ester carboxylesterase